MVVLHAYSEMINIDISDSMDSASEFVPLTITNLYAAISNYY